MYVCILRIILIKFPNCHRLKLDSNRCLYILYTYTYIFLSLHTYVCKCEDQVYFSELSIPSLCTYPDILQP